MSESTAGPERAGAATGPLATLREFVEYVPDGSTIPDMQWHSRHRKLVAVTLLHIPFLFLIGVYSGTAPIAEARIPATPLPMVLLEMGLIFGFAAASLYGGLSRRARTVLSVTAVFVSSGVLVQLSGGSSTESLC